MELLVRVAETGSMTLAAQQLQVTPAAVSAAVQRLEKSLGIRLFERTTRSLHPTDEGLIVIFACQDIVDRWRRVLDEATGTPGAVEGTVHLSAPSDTMYGVLEAVVVELCAAHPALRVVLNTSDALHHLHRDAIDIAIRYGALKDSTLSARKLFDGPRLLVAAPSYLAENGEPDSLEALGRHVCLTLHLASVPAVTWELQQGGEAFTVAIDSPLCGDGYLVRQWAVAGRGIAFKSVFDVIDELEAGELVQVLPEFSGGDVPIHAVFPARRFQPARVRVLGAAVSARFAARASRCRAWLAARTEP